MAFTLAKTQKKNLFFEDFTKRWTEGFPLSNNNKGNARGFFGLVHSQLQNMWNEDFAW